MVDSGNKNKSLEIVIDSKHYIKKRYSDIQRFFCELKYLKYFKDEDINVPFIYKFDKIQKTIIIDKIKGKNGSFKKKKKKKIYFFFFLKNFFFFLFKKKKKKKN